MSLQLGQTGEATILSNSVRLLGTNSAVVLYARTDDGTEAEVAIFLTAKSMNIARVQLKRCGFDVDAVGIDELEFDKQFLRGNKFPFAVEEYRGKLQMRVAMQAAPPKGEMDRLTDALRRANGPTPGDANAPPPVDDVIPF